MNVDNAGGRLDEGEQHHRYAERQDDRADSHEYHGVGYAIPSVFPEPVAQRRRPLTLTLLRPDFADLRVAVSSGTTPGPDRSLRQTAARD